MKRRHDAVKLNSALRKTTPSAKPHSSSPADAGCPSSSTSATRTAVASTAAARNGQSSRGTVARTVGSAVAAVMDVAIGMRHALGITGRADRLLEIVPARARGFDRPAGIGGPLDHGAGIEPHVLAAEQLGQDKPVGRRPMAGVAVADDRAFRQRRGDRGQLRRRSQPVAARIIERRTVQVDGTGDVAVGLRSRSLFLAGEKSRGTRIEQGRPARLAHALDLFDRRDASYGRTRR